MHCPSCGKEISFKNSYCDYCGVRITIKGRLESIKQFILSVNMADVKNKIKKYGRRAGHEKSNFLRISFKTGCNKKICANAVLVIAGLILLLLFSGGKQKNIDDVPSSTVQAANAESTPPAVTEIDSKLIKTVVPQAQPEPVDETPSPDVSDKGFRVINTVGTSYFECDYGFSENRAWVRRDTLEYDLINPNGEIIYEIPATVRIEGTSYPIFWSEISDVAHVFGFNPIKNGTTYIRGIANSYYDVSVIIDADGNELARFIGTDDVQCYIAGRTEDRFLLVYKDLSGAEGKAYCIPIGLDGKAADVPRLISDRNIDQWSVTVYDLGEGFFLMDLSNDFYAFYNLNNNTVQKSVSWEGNDPHSHFYNGTTLANGYLLTSDKLQKDCSNLVLTDYAGEIEGSSSHLYQYERVWCSTYCYYDRYVGLFDQNGSRINVPNEIGNESSVSLQASDDGYVLFIEEASTGKKLVSMMDPNNHFLYTRKVFPNDFYPEIGRGGYVLTYNKNHEYSILDRDSILHSLSDDLSVLPGLSELQFKGVGSGCLLETDQHLNIGQHSDSVAFIRSLDGKHKITSAKMTSNTRIMSEELANDTIIDLSQAKPIGTSGRRSVTETTTEDEIREMDKTGVIVADRLLDENQEILLFEKDGVSITFRNIPYDWYFSVNNDNSENKKVSVSSSDAVFYDGIYLDNLRGSARSITLNSGESGNIPLSFFDSEEMFMAEMCRVSSGLAELPLEEITFHFTVQIGSNADPVDYTRILRTSYYSEDDLNALYGDPVGDYEYEGDLVYSVYRIQDKAANVFAIRNRTRRNLSATHYMFYAKCHWYVNGEEYGGAFEVPIPAEGTGFVSFSNIDSVYKKLELPNGTPIDLELSIPLPGFEGEGTVMRLDLGQICN